MRTFAAVLVLFLGLSVVFGADDAKDKPLQCHQGTFSINKTGTLTTPCESSKAQSCQIVYSLEKKTVTQTCIDTLCSPNSKTEPISVCRLGKTTINCCCHGYGCNRRDLIRVHPRSYWA
ncbi:hypothetical protein M3Y99_01588800 [Aphelenchoides fujianensis]|nr:hypothetical protein M3Y99_01588800 [Aphelenchoides fujianensis]